MAKLGDIATYVNGYAFKPSDWSNEGLPIVRIQDLTGNSYETHRFNGTYDAKYEINNGDILISWSASLGVYVWMGGKALLNQHIFKVVFDKATVNESFFTHQVEHILEKSSTEAHGSTMKHLTKPVFDALPFYLPSLEKQTQIASILDKVASLIALHKRQLVKLDKLVKAQFIACFTLDCKYPVVPIGELVDKNIGRKKALFGKYDTIRYIDISSIDNRQRKITGFVEYPINDAPSRAQQLLKKDDILVSTVRPNLQNIARNPYSDGNVIASTGFCVLRCSKCLPEYLLGVVSSEKFTSAMSKQAKGANYPAVGNNDILQYRVPNAPLNEQERFAAFVREIEKLRLTIRQGLDRMETLKRALMQEYFGT